jgi:hypothetical protein
MKLFASLLCSALLLSANSASAAYYFVSNGTYFITGNVGTPASARPARADATDVAFFTPVAGYQRAGYQCVPLVEISKVNGRLSKRPGTACRSLTVQ